MVRVLALVLFLVSSLTGLGQAPGTLIWEYTTGGPVWSSPALDASGTLYLGSSDTLHALIASTGKTVWKLTVPGAAFGDASIGPDGTLYIGSVSNGRVWAVDSQRGTRKWEYQTGGDVWSAPAIGSNGAIFVASNDGTIHALDSGSGTKRWEFRIPGGTDHLYSSPTVGSNGTLYVGATNKLFALNGNTGAKLWEYSEPGGWFDAPPSLGADGTVFVGHSSGGPVFANAGQVLAIDGASGKKKWALPTEGPILSSPTLGADGTVYVGVSTSWEGAVMKGGEVYALDGGSGSIRWVSARRSAGWSSPALGADGTLYIGGGGNSLGALDAATGAMRWEFQTGGMIDSSPVIAADGSLYVGSSDGKLYALRCSSPGLARGGWPMYRGNASHPGNLSMTAQRPGGDFVWRVQKGANTMHVGGSVAALREGDLPYPESFTKAFTASRKLVLPVDPSELSGTAAESYLSDRSLLPPGSTLQMLLGEDDYLAVQNLLGGLGLPRDSLLQHRPWFMHQVLSQQLLARSGFDPARAIDTYLLGLAKTLFKPRVFLDSYQQAIDTASGIADSAWVDLIRDRDPLEPLESLNDRTGFTGNLVVNQWRLGDVSGMTAVMERLAQRHPAVYGTLVGKPLDRWLPLIETQLQGGQSPFVLLRAGHLLGASGLLQRLRDRGCHVSRLPLSPPFLVSHPAGKAGAKGGEVEFSVTAEGAEPLTYRWYKDDVALPGSNTNRWRVRNLSATQAGRYHVVVSNELGKATSTMATLSLVTETPRIVVQPQGGTFREGDRDILLKVEASGSFLEYQWFRDGTPIAGATDASWVIRLARRPDRGSYLVRVRNPAGSVMSQPASVDVTPMPPGGKLWDLPIGDSPWISRPALGPAHTVVVWTTSTEWRKENKVVAVDATSGTQLWQTDMGPAVWEGPIDHRPTPPSIGADGTIFLGGGTRKVFAMDGGTGAIRWEFNTSAPVWKSPAIGPDGVVHVAGTDGRIYALRAATGTALWQVSLGNRNTEMSHPSLAVGRDGTLYVSGTDRVHALDGKTGARLWQSPEIMTMGQGASLAIGADDTVYVGGTSLYALEPGRGAIIWSAYSTAFGGVDTVIGSDGTLFNGNTAFASLRGRTRWTATADSENPALRLPVIGALGSDGTVYAMTEGAVVLALDGRNGEKLWESTTSGGTPGTPILPTLGGDGTLYVASGGRLMALATGSSGLMASPWPQHGSLGSIQNRIASSIRVTTLDQEVPAAAGERIVLEVPARSDSPMTLQWSRNGVPIPGATNSTLVLPSLNAASEGIYRLSAALADGRSTVVTARVRIPTAPPRILRQPEGHLPGLMDWLKELSASEGATNAVLRVTAGEARQLQWHRNGQALPGATNSTLELPILRPWHEGSYTVELRNPAGSVTSEPTVVRVFRGTPEAPIVRFPAGAAIWSSPAIGDNGIIYAGSLDGSLYAWDSVWGQQRWEFRSGDAVESSPALGADGTVFFGSNDHHVYAIDGTTGALKWRFATGDRVCTSPAVGSDGTVYIGSNDRNLYALDGSTGAKKWSFTTGGPVESSPAVGADGTVCFGSSDAKVYALDGRTGTKKWDLTTGAEVSSSPAIGADGTVYVGSVDHRVYALDGRTGAKKWEFLTGGPVWASPTLDPHGTVYVGSDDSRLHALDATTGAPKWQFRAGDRIAGSASVGSDGTIYVGSVDHKVHALEARTGSKKWDSKTGGIIRSSPALAKDGTVYVGSGDGLLYGFSTESLDLAASPWPRFRAGNRSRGRVEASVLIQASRAELLVSVGDRAVLETSVSAPATARLQWFKDSQPLQGATLPSVSIPAAKATDAGLYRLTGFLPDGRSSSIELRLEVRIPPPQIVLQPQGGRFAEGTADAVLVAEAAWVDRFQWYFNGSLLPDATNSTLKLPLLRPANSGAYTVRVTGAGGVEIVSEAATVEVVRQTPGGAVWRFKAGDAIASSPAIGADGTLFVGSDDTRVHAIDGSTGTERWSFQTGGRVTASPTVGPDDTVYVGSEDTRIYALDGATGTKRWEYPTGGAVVASPAMGVDGTIYVGSQDTKVHAIHGKSGARRWEYPTGAAIRSSPALGVDGTVYVGSVDGWVHALDGATGTNRWKFATGGAIHGSPALGADGTVYLGSGDRKIYALSGATGTKRWEHATGGAILGSPAIGPDGTLYLGSDDQRIHALDGHSGSLRWTFNAPGAVRTSPAIGNDGTLYVGSEGRRIHALDAMTGVERWSLETGTGVPASCTIAPDGTVLVGGGDGFLRAIASGSTGLAASPWPMFQAGPRHLGRLESSAVAPSFRWNTSSQGHPGLEITAPARTPIHLESSTNLITWTGWTNVTIGMDGSARLEVQPTLERLFLKWVGPSPPGFVWIGPGTFLMGSPLGEAERSTDEVQHAVTLTRGFWMSDHEVTQAEYRAVMGSDPSYSQSDNRRPVDQVTWDEAVLYCQKLTELERAAGRITRQQAYRLPTEAEWEYAARAGTSEARHGALDAVAWWEGNSGLQAHPVKQKAANAWGLNDMLGNVWEWCSDWYSNDPTGSVTDPRGPGSGAYRVIRGGSWGGASRFVRSAYRGRGAPDSRGNLLGFRPVLSSIR